MPAEVFGLGDEQIALFLHHLWATDGCVWTDRNEAKAPRIYYATTSQRLAWDVHSLLLRLGVNSRVRAVAQGRHRTGYHVIVQGSENQVRFAEVVGCHGERARHLAPLMAVACGSHRQPQHRLGAGRGLGPRPVQVDARARGHHPTARRAARDAVLRLHALQARRLAGPHAAACRRRSRTTSGSPTSPPPTSSGTRSSTSFPSARRRSTTPPSRAPTTSSPTASSCTTASSRTPTW